MNKDKDLSTILSIVDEEIEKAVSAIKDCPFALAPEECIIFLRGCKNSITDKIMAS